MDLKHFIPMNLKRLLMNVKIIWFKNMVWGFLRFDRAKFQILFVQIYITFVIHT